MLRIITGFLLLIISQISFADTIPATPSTATKTVYRYLGVDYSTPQDVCAARGAEYWLLEWTGYHWCKDSYKFQPISVSSNVYSCPSGYNLSDSSGALSSSGQYCTKSACSDYAGNTTQLWFLRNTVPNAGCYAGCKATATVAINYGDSSVEMPYVYQKFSISDEVCSGVMDYTDAATAIAANKAAQDAADLQAKKDACGAAGWTSGTSNGELVITCKTPDSPSTDTGTSTGTDGTSSGMGTDAGSPETNTSGSQTGTTGGGVGGLGGDGYGEGGSAGSSGGTGGSSGAGSGTGTDGGSSSGTSTDGGSSSGDGSGTDGGSSSGDSSGTGSGDGSGSGSGTGDGTGSGSGDGSGTEGGSGSGSGSGTGEGSEEEGDSGSASSSDGAYSYSDTERDGRTFTDIFSTHFDELQQTQLFGSASGFFKVSFNGSCSPIEMPFFSGSISVDVCSFFDRWSTMISAIVIFACSVFAFRTAMD